MNDDTIKALREWPLGSPVRIQAGEYFQVRLTFNPAIRLSQMVGITCYLEGEMETPV